jgi:hypothetical protein
MIMSRVTCNLYNNCGYDLVMSNCDGHGYRGSDWGGTVLAPGTKIGAGQTVTLGSEGKPGDFETPHWGWIYFETSNYPNQTYTFQIYLEINTGGSVASYQLGDYSSKSSRDNPMPEGTYGNLPGGTLSGDTVTYSFQWPLSGPSHSLAAQGAARAEAV